MSSKSTSLARAAAISSTSGAMLSASLRTGTITETAGAAALTNVSPMICPARRRGGGLASCRERFLWGDKLPGNPFDARERRAGPWSNRAVRANHESQPPRGIPIAHHQRAERAGDRTDHDVAREMRGEHHPAYGDEHGIGPHHGPHPWPQRADRHRGGEGIDGVAGRQTCVFDAPAKRMIDERAGATFDERPGAADETLADREDQSRQAGRK